MTDPLFPSDDEIAERLFGKDRERRASFVHKLPILEAQGFPRRSVEFGGGRYWPAVRKWLDVRWGLAKDAPAATEDGEEDWTDAPRTARSRPRSRQAS